MKRFLFTMMALVALVLVANTTFGQTAVTPYLGSTHEYTLSTLTIGGATATATVFLDDDTDDLTPELVRTDQWGLTLPKVNGAGTTATASPNYYEIALTSASTSMAFSITYDETSLAAGDYYVWVIIDDVSGCSNYIRLYVDVQGVPTWTLAIDGTDGTVCMPLETAANLEDNEDAFEAGGGSQTFDYVISLNTSAAGTKTYDFTFTLGDLNYDGNNYVITQIAGGGTFDNTNAATGVYTVTGATSAVTLRATFTSKAGVTAESVSGTISNAKMNVGGGVYDVTAAGSTFVDNVSVGSTPSIGGFSY